jgi:hypothetical protein
MPVPYSKLRRDAAMLALRLNMSKVPSPKKLHGTM